MHRNICGFLLLLLSLVACSNETPMAPTTSDGVSLELPSIDETGIALAELQSMGLQPPVELALDSGDYKNPSARSVTLRTWKSAYQVKRAAEECARDNHGEFPTTLRTLIDYLPGHKLLKNALTGYRTEPNFNDYASYLGAIGYMAIISHEGIPVGCIITARGATYEEYLYIWYIPE